MRMTILPILMLPCLLAACADDMARPGTWRASGVNDANLRVMAEDPRDLRQGRAAFDERGQAGAVAIERLEAGRRFPLPPSSISSLASGGGEPGGDAGSAGGANAR
jgi:hypothetical protein